MLCGITMFARGRWPRRVGDTPPCPKCDYILTGNDSGVCPECGSALESAQIIHGERHPRRAIAWGGAAVALFGMTLVGLYIGGMVSNVNWNQYKLLSWLLKDLDSPQSSVSTSAWTEVQRRLSGKLLSESQQNQLVNKALQTQQSATGRNYEQTLFRLITQRFSDHKLSPAQEQQFFDNALKDVLEIRPIVGSKDRVPYWIMSRGRGPYGWWVRTRTKQWQVDDGKMEKGDGGSVGNSSFGGCGTGSSIPPQPFGKHHLRVTVEMSARAGNANVGSDDQSFDKVVTRDLDADFESVEGHAPITKLAAPDASVLRPLFTVKLSFQNSYLNINVQSKGMPVDAAFDCLVRVDGKEYPCGSVNFHANGDSGFSTGGGGFPKAMPAKVDFILRSSEDAARATTDLTRIWNGEIVIPDVPVKQPSSQPSAAIMP